LVTGGAEFVGGWIADVMIDFGSDLTVVNDFSTGRIKNTDHLQRNKKFQ
jgi:hypothetical protein